MTDNKEMKMVNESMVSDSETNNENNGDVGTNYTCSSHTYRSYRYSKKVKLHYLKTFQKRIMKFLT